MRTYKRLLSGTVICIAMSLSGCMSGSSTYQSERLSNVPTNPHQREVELYFSGEWPKEEYMKIAALEVRGAGTERYGDLIKALKNKAQNHGADAVMVQDRKYSTNEDNQVTNVLHGVAIKYKSNLDLGLMPKVQRIEVYLKESMAYEPLLNLSFTPGGDIKDLQPLSSKAMSSYESYVKRYALNHLLKEQGPEWAYKEKEGLVVKRERYEKGFLQKSIDVEYNAQKQPVKLVIVEPGLQEEIRCTYNDNNQLVSRTILRDKVPYLYEKYAYDQTGKVEEVQVYAGSAPEQPVLKSTFAYYMLEEVK